VLSLKLATKPVLVVGFTATAFGPAPAGIVAVTVFVAPLITETVLPDVVSVPELATELHVLARCTTKRVSYTRYPR
jgi:hypothetical protein